MGALYGRIEDLCREKGVSITEMCKTSGVPRSALSDYKYGRIKSISVDKLQRMSGFFGVTIDYLLGNTNEKNVVIGKPGTAKMKLMATAISTIEKAPTEVEPGVIENDFMIAFSGEVKDLSEEDKQLVLNMVRTIRQQRNNK